MNNPQSTIRNSKSAAGGDRKRVLAIASGGGHWVQLLRLTPAFEGCHITFATTRASYRYDVDGHDFRVIPDGNRWQKRKLVRSAMGITWLILRLRPDVIVSTGAAPGYFAIRFGKLFGIKTVWLDSIANAEELSMSGEKAGRHADLWLTQWEHLARESGPHYRGNVLG